ncbi:MAG: glutamate N-acetyltransferase / amino-acid N-acetyltransferase, partial [Verrucomicrobiota bacterium]
MKPRSRALKRIPGSVCAPRGFRAAAVFCDIKRLGTGKGSEKGQKRDLALIVSDVPAAVAGMFTSNQVCAAPVKVSAKHAKRNSARGIVVNSGNANACTGARGLADAKLMTQITAENLGVSASEILVCSTGRIGVPMPMANVKRGIAQAAGRLARSARSARDTAEAIMTSDTRRKEIAVEFELGGATVRMGGICKGAGMIQPQMLPHATMLGFITTDAAISSDLLRRCLAEAVGQSFNRITVDGDMSTNDTVLILANGMAGNGPTDVKSFQRALNFVTLELAKMIVRDGEGVTRFITLHVRGARTAADAEAVARSVANSTLVKTSWFGGDP